MRRREFIKLVGGATASVLWPLAARAQPAERVRRIGVLMGYAESDPAAQSLVAAFRAALTKLGWTEGSSLQIEFRWGSGDANRIGTFSKELVGLQPDAILSHTTAVIVALANETRTVPIVFVTVPDPIGSGFGTSLAHPGRNITGFTAIDSAMGGKWMELLKELVPRTERAALLFSPATAVPLQFLMPSIQAAASSLAVEVSVAPVRVRDEIEVVIAAQARNPGGNLIVLPDAFNAANRELIIALAARYRLPAIYYNRYFADSGGLIAYGSDNAEAFRQAAGYIDRILKGAKPGDLPIQLPTKFELVINMKTAKASGLDVPLHLQQIADEVID
jgi:putative tryptophan/tyrosine transport system substrate-binding protein